VCSVQREPISGEKTKGAGLCSRRKFRVVENGLETPAKGVESFRRDAPTFADRGPKEPQVLANVFRVLEQIASPRRGVCERRTRRGRRIGNHAPDLQEPPHEDRGEWRRSLLTQTGRTAPPKPLTDFEVSFFVGDYHAASETHHEPRRGVRRPRRTVSASWVSFASYAFLRPPTPSFLFFDIGDGSRRGDGEGRRVVLSSLLHR